MSSQKIFQIYEQLAEQSSERGEPSRRDRFLVLAADAAWTAELFDEADRLRQRLVQANPHHLLKPYHSWEEALRSQDVRDYLAELRKNCPPEMAEQLRQTQAPPQPPQPSRVIEPELEPPIYKLQPPAEPEPPRPRLPILPPKPAVSPPPPTRPQPMPLTHPAALMPMSTEEDNNEPTVSASAWVATALFVVFLFLFLALAGYTLGQPFLMP